jgi:type III pantothenate kinase
MLLAIDIGNTNIHLGLRDLTPEGAPLEPGGWHSTWRAQTVADRMADEYAALLRSLFEDNGYSLADVRGVAMASVVPALTVTFIEMCEHYLGQTPLNVEPGIRTGVRIMLDNPHEVGADRVVNAAAVQRFYGGPAIVVDFGTATTFDVINREGDYLGGAISPGIRLAHDALVGRAARLLKVDLKPPPSPIGHNTVQAMQSGLFLGYVAMIEGLVARIREALGEPEARVIATGGLAPLFAEHTSIIEQIALNLTLDGLCVIWELNR